MTDLSDATAGWLPGVLGAFPPPPLTDRLLFESPLLVPVAVLVLAVIAGFGLGRAAKAREGKIVMAVGLVLAVGIAISSRVVETDREAIRRLTGAFIADVMDGDRGAVEGVLGPRLTIAAGGSSAPLNAREFILNNVDRVGAEIERYASNVQEAAVIAERAGRSKFAFNVLQSRSYGFGVSTWVLEWQKTPGAGWQITAIDLVALNGQPAPTGVFSRVR